MLILGWLVRTRMMQGIWSWQITPLKRIDLASGVAPKALPQPEEQQAWRKAVTSFLNAL